MITVKVTGMEEIRKMFNALPKDINKAVGRSINDAAKHGTSEVKDVIYKEYNIKRRDLNNAVRVTQTGRAAWPMAMITVSSRPIPLIDFSPYQYQSVRGYNFKSFGKHWTQLKRAPKGKQGVFVSVARRSKNTNIKPAFIGNSKYGGPMVFLRNDKERKIAPMYVKTIPTFLLLAGRVQKVMQSITNYYESRLKHHLQRIGQ